MRAVLRVVAGGKIMLSQRWAWLVLAAMWAASPAHAAEPSNRTIHVYVTGALPGADGPQAAQLIADAMLSLRLPGWRFVVTDSPNAADRMVWRITPLPYAVNDLARMGRSLKPLQDLFGRHRYFDIQVQLFLDGLYQTEAFATTEIQNARTDAGVPSLVASLVQPMMTIGLHPEMPTPARAP